MTSSALRIPITLLFTCGFLGSFVGNSQAELPFSSCPGKSSFSCATLNVPLDRSGNVPGAISLKIRKKSSGPIKTSTALLTLAGGPGEPAIPSAEEDSKTFQAALATRDYIVFDSRGTGTSNPLHCKALNYATDTAIVTRAAAVCAKQIGPARGFYRTADTVEDIEAVRREAGYEKLTIVGFSYGTKVALAYASRYPDHVEKLVLDSFALANIPDPLNHSGFKAMRRALNELCEKASCKGITSNPTQDVAVTVKKIGQEPLHAELSLATGKKQRIELARQDAFQVLNEGDFNPAFRAMSPAAFRSAAKGDPVPLGRLLGLSAGLNFSSPKSKEDRQVDTADSSALALATLCEEITYPWERFASLADREQQFKATLQRTPQSDFFPFDRQTAAESPINLACLGWPNASPAPKPFGSPANVPTLILNGHQDLGTPLEDAKELANTDPQVTIVDVPFAGHQVIYRDPSGCGRQAAISFLQDNPIQTCQLVKQTYKPTLFLAANLRGVKPIGTKGRAGRATNAAVLTVKDTLDVLLAVVGQTRGDFPQKIGGLRGGAISISGSSLRLHNVVTIPGIQVSGKVVLQKGKLAETQSFYLKVKGRRISGRLKLKGKTIVGMLNKKHIYVKVKSLSS